MGLMEFLILLPIVLGAVLVISAVVGLIVLRVQTQRKLGSLHQWVSDLVNRFDQVEREVGLLSQKMEALGRNNTLERLAQQQTTQASRHSQELQELRSHLSGLEAELARLDQRLTHLPTAAPSPGAPMPTEGSPGGLFSSPLAREVLGLLDKGVATADIARQTGLPMGEIELIRGLRGLTGREARP